MITPEQEATLQMLEADTHVFWTPEAARTMTRPFGFECKVHVEKAEPQDPKGLTLRHELRSAEGAASWDISRQIAEHLKLHTKGYLGRGFQVRGDCDTIREYLKRNDG